ncbi:AAA-like domain-containing protein [Limisalsivibrio acetivorans]|uniref:AAA-like domain-containing protein n=1 Tax=Limisalsivibrio acetivorans TaxID=1304888 RepID=UPI0003B56695|nr:AAA-like domain-containing protein [Limisalsivibrio acetivorans]
MANDKGIKPSVNLYGFTDEEHNIITSAWANELSITYTKSDIDVKGSKYKCFLINPTEHYRDMFNFNKEIAVVFSPYKQTDSRLLEAIAIINKSHSNRIDKICLVVITKDMNPEESIKDIVDDVETQIIVPFSYQEFQFHDDFRIRNRFIKYLYSRDLFAFESPLKTERFFFGRKEIVATLFNRFKSKEHSGLFGLRKTGKTSIIYSLRRHLENDSYPYIHIDCQDPGFHQRRWNEALSYIFRKQGSEGKYETIYDDSLFSEKDASFYFEKSLVEISKKHQNKPVLLIFDEIEHMSNGLSPSYHWNEGNDFVLFWQSIRATLQSNHNLGSFLIAGTNPTCIESTKVNNIDNPLYNIVHHEYVASFQHNETRDMVRTLGRRMGLKFEESVFHLLNDDYGGHPFLIRHMCSHLFSSFKNDTKPLTITKDHYKDSKETFLNNSNKYFQLILEVLKTSYDFEYELLVLLAEDDIETFNDFCNQQPDIIGHLLGYNVIKRGNNKYVFNIESMKEYLLKDTQSQPLKSDMDIKHYILGERTYIEENLRQFVKSIIYTAYGSESKNIISKHMDKKSTSSLSYRELFDPNKNKIYFNILIKIICSEWDKFKNHISLEKSDFTFHLGNINKLRKVDAHASKISKTDLEQLKLSFKKVKEELDNYNSSIK